MWIFSLIAISLASFSPAYAGKCPKPAKPNKAKHENGKLKSVGCLMADGTRHGPWEEWYPEANLRASGEYDNGMRVGPWVDFHRNGNKQAECTYARDERDGPCITWHEGGQKESEGEYSTGKRSGAWQAWYSNGQIHERGAYTFDYGASAELRQGDWVVYYADGTKQLEAHYEAGEADGFYRTWHPTGQLETEGVMKRGKLDGDVAHYHPNGVKALIATYVAGAIQGSATHYSPTGHKLEEANYKDGKRHGMSVLFSAAAEPVAHQCYQYGERIWAAPKADWKCPTPVPTRFPPLMVDGKPFSDGFAAVRMGTKWGYINADGKVTVGPRFASAGSFVNGIARASVDGKEFYAIDERGDRSAKPAPPAGAKGKTGGISKVEKSGSIDYRKGGRSLWRRSEPPEGKAAALFPVRKDGKWGYIDAEGKVVVEPQYDAAAPFSEGLAAVGTRGRIGFIGPDGAWAILPRFTRARSFSCGMAVVELEGRLTYTDRYGVAVTDKELLEANDCQDGLARVLVGDKFGFLHHSGRMLVASLFDDVGDFSDGLARARKDAAYIDRTGRSVHKGVLPQSDFGDGKAVALARHEGKQRYSVFGRDGSITPIEHPIAAANDPVFTAFEGDVATFGSTTGWGVLKSDGTVLVPNAYQTMRGFSEGRAAARNKDGWVFVDAEGKVVGELAFAEVGDFHDGVARAKDASGSWGLVGKDGAWVVEPAWDRMADASKGLVQVHKGDAVGYISTEGTVVWEPKE